MSREPDLVERLRRYADDIRANGEGNELDEAADEVERLRALIRDLLWAVGHDDEQILNETTARAKAALERKP